MKLVLTMSVLMSIFFSANAAADSVAKKTQEAKRATADYTNKIQSVEQDSASIEDSIVHRDRYLAQNKLADNSGVQIRILHSK